MDDNNANAQIKQYVDMGKDWLEGKIVIEEFNGIKLNEKQVEFINAKDRFCLVSGGFASGKTTSFIIKLILISLFFPGNRILLGRKTRQEIERVTLPDFFDVCPQGIYEHKVGPGIIKFFNGSEIIFFGLDALQSGSGQDIKKAEQAIKSLNLGAVFIDQLEEIDQRIFEALDGRLRRNTGFLQMNLTTNPANFWAYDYFKANPRPRTRLIETSMLDNKDFLPPDFIQSQLEKPKVYVDRYVYGLWDPSTGVEGGVFAEEYLRDQSFHVTTPKRTLDGVKIFHEPVSHEYQIGVDPSEGSVDPCNITVVDKDTGDVCATYSAFVPVNVQVEKIVQLAMMYSLKSKPLVVPESQGGGVAVIESLKKIYPKIYEREVFNQREKKATKKLGFHTNYASKTQLIENMKELLQKKFPKIRDQEYINEMKTFIYQNDVMRKGAGAQSGYHDDRIMGLMLAFWNVQPITPRERGLLSTLKNRHQTATVKYVYE